MNEENTVDAELDNKYDIEALIAAGVYEAVGVDKNGETTYRFNFEKGKELVPEIYHAEMNALDAAIVAAVDAGFLELDFGYDENGEPAVEYIVTGKGLALPDEEEE